MEGAVKALCNRLVVAEMSSHPSKDLAEQCIKVWKIGLVSFVRIMNSFPMITFADYLKFSA